MSYEPVIIVSKPDLEAKRIEIESWEYQKPPRRPSKQFERKQAAYKFLQNVLDKSSSFTIKGLELVMFHPELTSFNKDVRQALTDIDIEYAEDN